MPKSDVNTPNEMQRISCNNIFTARPEAQRCQVTPYVVNVLVVVVLVGGER